MLFTRYYWFHVVKVEASSSRSGLRAPHELRLRRVTGRRPGDAVSGRGDLRTRQPPARHPSSPLLPPEEAGNLRKFRSRLMQCSRSPVARLG